METLSLCFMLWLAYYCLLLAQLGPALEAGLSWFLQIYLGMLVLLIVLILFIILSLAWFLSGALERKKRRIKAAETVQSPRSARQIRELVNQITLG